MSMNLNDILNSLHQHEDTADATKTAVRVLVDGRGYSPHSVESVRADTNPDTGETTLWVEVREDN